MNLRAIALVLSLALFAPPAARAQSADPRVQALIDEGTEEFRTGRFADALRRFESAFELGHVEALQYHIARCHEELGHTRQAIEAYEAFLGTDAPTKAKAKAEAALGQLRRTKGRLLFDVSPEWAEVWVDGERAAGSGPLEVAPGDHEVVARADQHHESTTSIRVEPGEEQTVALSLLPKEVQSATTPLPEPVVEERRDAGEIPLSTWGFVTLGVGAALTAGGTVSYILGELDHRDIVNTPGYGTEAIVISKTRRQALDLQASGDTKKTVGYALWGIGGAAVVTSVILLVLDEGDETPALTIAPEAMPGGGAFTLGGRF